MGLHFCSRTERCVFAMYEESPGLWPARHGGGARISLYCTKSSSQRLFRPAIDWVLNKQQTKTSTARLPLWLALRMLRVPLLARSVVLHLDTSFGCRKSMSVQQKSQHTHVLSPHIHHTVPHCARALSHAAKSSARAGSSLGSRLAAARAALRRSMRA